MLPAAGEILQLETGPPSRSNRCLQTELEGVLRVYQPPLGLGGQMLTACSPGGSNNSPGNPIMARFPALFPLLLDFPKLLPEAPDLITNFSEDWLPLPGGASILAAWYISGSHTRTQDLQTRQSHSSWPPGGVPQPRITTPARGSGTHTNPVSPTLGNIFFAAKFRAGRRYRSLNCYRSGLFSILQPIDGFDVGHHPLVCRILKGIVNQHPPAPRYRTF